MRFISFLLPVGIRNANRYRINMFYWLQITTQVFFFLKKRVAAYRCYLDSLEIYQGRHWTLIEDHIHYALGRHSILLNDLVEGVNYMGKLMRASRQNSRQQAAYLKDFLGAYAVRMKTCCVVVAVLSN